MTSRVAETRSIDLSQAQLELRQEKGEESEDEFAVGYGAVFNSSTNVANIFTEEVTPTAFNKTLKEANVRTTFNHNFDNLLGTTQSGTAQLSVDDSGLLYRIKLDTSPLHQNVRSMLARGDLTGASWMGYVIAEEWSNLDEDIAHRTIKEIALIEVGPVAIPQYEDSSAALRSLEVCRQSDLDSLQAARDDLASARNRYYMF